MGDNPSHFRTGHPDMPVDSVTWFDALSFLQNLNELGGGRFRLPTEAEWEYACRAGATTRYYWGNDPEYTWYDRFAWNYFNSGHTPHPVGLKEPNAWGLYDMSGNMQEWCLDWYTPYPGEDQVDPQGLLTGDERVIRGGFWEGSHAGMRSAARNRYDPANPANTISFRVAFEFPHEESGPTATPTPLDTNRTARFGASLQSFVGDVVDDQSLLAMREDHLPLIRYFAGESVADNLNMIQRAIEHDMQVIMVFITGNAQYGIQCDVPPCSSNFPSQTECCSDCWWNLDLISDVDRSGRFVRRYTCNSEGYARWIEFRLTQIDEVYPGAIGTTLIGVQIGNEEEVKWGYREPDGYYAGRAYAAYYLAAHQAIKARWPQLTVLGGSIENHRALDYDRGGVISTWGGDAGQGSRGFLNGMFQYVLEQPGATAASLPDVLAINGYPGEAPPEYLHGGRGTREWINRMDTLNTICAPYGYHPRYAVMEYGFSPSPASVYGATGANEMTQAVYYLRYALLNATMKTSRGDIWDYVMYWVHHYNGQTSWDTGWFRSPSHLPDAARAIRKVGQILHAPPEGEPPGLGIGDHHQIWIPDWSVRNEENPAIGDNLMQCGWMDAQGEKWGALWRYKNNVEYYYEAPARAARFSARGENPGPAKLYKFIFQPEYGYDHTYWVELPLAPINGVSDPNDPQTVSYELPATMSHPSYGPIDVVDENPVFLRFADGE